MARPYHRRVARFTMLLPSAAFAALLAPALQAGMTQSTNDGARAVPPATEGAYRWLDPIIDLRALLVSSYVDPIDAPAMQRAAMEAMTKALGDPYTLYIPPADEGAFRRQLSGSYVGIGVELDLDDGRPIVITAIDGSPAMEAGILAGDTILFVDGKSTEGIGAATLESLLPGAPGTVAALVIRRADGNERTLNVPRRVVETPSVKGILRDADGWRFTIDSDRRVAYIRIAQFNDRTVAEVDAALARIRADGVSGIILDMRDNGGGSLTAAVGVVDRFISEGAIVSIRGRGDTGRTWDATSSPEDMHIPMVVLINQGSASASEVVAGALRDNGCAKIIGTRSYGKGSVQDVLQLPDGAGTVKITTARYYLPSGTSPHRAVGASRWGVEPDTGFRVPMTEEQSIARAAARQLREAGGTASSPPVSWNSSASITRVAHDPQLAGAVDAIQGYLDMVEWPVVGDLSGDVGAGSDELRSSIEYRRRLLDELQKTDQAISTLRSSGAGVDDPLLGNDASLIDGAVELRDRDGHVIGRWIVKDPSALRTGIGASAIPAPEYTPAREPEGK